LYEPEWAVMEDKEPEAVTFTDGSDVAVYSMSV
jgi:hypothetical protein